ncbi:pseudouridylate synthase [Pedobacter namyangjuensis]|uniref:pseudouridylate synthase n=1 Tax=Pedobacter namyangjuensis TaxID=600626 RepID=UPI000DE44858|nr:pseudouridylate synthase [Pedobacter namyangjuensis]
MHNHAKNNLFIRFKQPLGVYDVPANFSQMVNGVPHQLCALAAEDLQHHILNQKEWQHNFGLDSEADGMVIGKMFGVLVVENQQKEIGYLAAFSGKLAGKNHHAKFVPPVFDTLATDGFLNKGMQKLALLNDEIRALEFANTDKAKIQNLKVARKKYSNALQSQIFEHYHFLNQAGEEKSLNELFTAFHYKNPPAGAGECAGPKLLQHAFLHKLKPLALAEFWWGLSPKSNQWRHKQFYACCKEECEPILAHMLKGV